MSYYIFYVDFYQKSTIVPKIKYGPFDTIGQAVEYAEEMSGFEWQSLTSFMEGKIQDFLKYLYPKRRIGIRIKNH